MGGGTGGGTQLPGMIVVTLPAVEGIVAAIAKHGINAHAVATIEGVLAVAAVDGVVAAKTIDVVIKRVAGDRVNKLGAFQVLHGIEGISGTPAIIHVAAHVAGDSGRRVEVADGVTRAVTV